MNFIAVMSGNKLNGSWYDLKIAADHLFMSISQIHSIILIENVCGKQINNKYK